MSSRKPAKLRRPSRSACAQNVYGSIRGQDPPTPREGLLEHQVCGESGFGDGAVSSQVKGRDLLLEYSAGLLGAPFQIQHVLLALVECFIELFKDRPNVSANRSSNVEPFYTIRQVAAGAKECAHL